MLGSCSWSERWRVALQPLKIPPTLALAQVLAFVAPGSEVSSQFLAVVFPTNESQQPILTLAVEGLELELLSGAVCGRQVFATALHLS